MIGYQDEFLIIVSWQCLVIFKVDIYLILPLTEYTLLFRLNYAYICYFLSYVKCYRVS